MTQLDVYEAMHTARAIRKYRDEPVGDDVLRRCIEAATWAPSGGNSQPWKFVILRSEPVRKVLGETYRRAWAESRGNYGVTGDEAPDDPSPRARMGRSMQRFVDDFHKVPVYVLFCLRRRGTRQPGLHEGASIYPAMQNFVLAARAEGLGTVLTTFFLGAEKELREIVGIPDNYMLAGLLPVGWAAGKHGPVRRLPVEKVTFVERWDNALS